jgi:peptide-methionine (S)-S-oxide reductase
MKNKIFTYPIFLIFFMLFSSENFAKNSTNKETIILAGGCFWGVEELFQNFEGVVETEVGYTGGFSENPTYDTVSTGLSGHAESVKITFDNSKTSLEKILKFFFAIHDPTQLNRQQNDVGTQYRSEIFYFNEVQKQKALNIIDQAEKLNIYKAKIQTKLSLVSKFYKAEKYHQNYLKNNPNGYTCHYLREEWKF